MLCKVLRAAVDLVGLTGDAVAGGERLECLTKSISSADC